MRRNKRISGRNTNGVIITLVAVFMLGVVGAMAALSIDVVTLYTARSEAQLAADAAALAGARILANSGTTSNPTDTTLATNAEALALTVATRVARNNEVGGNNLVAADITVTFPATTSPSDLEVNVRVQRTDLPTFFARIWGKTHLAVAASATAEAYNSSGTSGTPVAPLCVKPWLLPNMDPTQSTGTIFTTTTGAITTPSLVGKSWPNAAGNTSGLYAQSPGSGPVSGSYYAGMIGASTTEFPAPTEALPCYATGYADTYQIAIAGCVTRPIACGSSVDLDTATTTGPNRDVETLPAVSCLIHYNTAAGDTDSIAATPASTPFQFLGGHENPVPNAVAKDVLVSDSLVTIPVFDSSSGGAPAAGAAVQIIGFLQLFLNPYSAAMPSSAAPSPTPIPVTIINMVGCGTRATGTPIIGNGSSPVAVRLISP